jgi:hypothetical protein
LIAVAKEQKTPYNVSHLSHIHVPIGNCRRAW